MLPKIDRDYILERLEKEDESKELLCAIKDSREQKRITPILVGKIADHFLHKDREIIHPISIGKICEMIRSCEYLDWLLYLTQKRYRDHSQHQFYTAILGWILLNMKIPNNNTVMGDIVKLNNLGWKIIKKAWWIASLLHDHAYPLAYLLRTIPSIKSSISDNQLSALLGLFHNLYSNNILKVLKIEPNIPNRIELIKKELEKYLFCFFEKDEFKILIDEKNLYSHGIWSAANIVAKIEEAGCPYMK